MPNNVCIAEHVRVKWYKNSAHYKLVCCCCRWLVVVEVDDDDDDDMRISRSKL